MVFGSFDSICKQAPYPLCPLVTPQYFGPSCYSRSIDVGSVLFEPSLLVMQLISFVVTLVIIYMVRTKYTAVGRKEMSLFFYLFGLHLIFEFIVMSGLVKHSSKAFVYFVSVHNSLVTGLIYCLLFTGFIGFQFAEDGTRLSLWSLKLSTLGVVGTTFLVNVLTFLDIGLSSKYPVVVFVFYFILNPTAILIYFIMQFILVVNTLDELWPLGNLILGLLIFVLGQVIVMVFSSSICERMSHYVDGTFFGCICTLLSVMMVYKYWDTITKEDLEFSVGKNENVWEVEELLVKGSNSFDYNDNNYAGADGYLKPTTDSIGNKY